MISIRLNEDLKKSIDNIAVAEERSRNYIINKILKEYVSNYERKRNKGNKRKID